MKLIAAICLILFSLTALGLESAQQVIGISDGDTLTLLHDGKPLKIRLANIDAPEKSQAFGQQSKKSLSELCWGKDAQFEPQTLDRYGRTVAVVYCGGVEVNRAQVERGMAWVYRKYAKKDSPLYLIESAARNARIGLWAEPNPLEPWEFRKSSKSSKIDDFYRGMK